MFAMEKNKGKVQFGIPHNVSQRGTPWGTCDIHFLFFFPFFVLREVYITSLKNMWLAWPICTLEWKGYGSHPFPCTWYHLIFAHIPSQNAIVLSIYSCIFYQLLLSWFVSCNTFTHLYIKKNDTHTTLHYAWYLVSHTMFAKSLNYMSKGLVMSCMLIAYMTQFVKISNFLNGIFFFLHYDI